MLLSVIIPVYNVENYIKDCLDSILKIKLDSMEILVIDDGSVDQSIEIVNTYQDSRIRIISQENKGLSGARNRGISEAKGRYLYFIDSDDFLKKPEIIVQMLQMAEINELDFVMGNGCYYWNDIRRRPIYFDFRKPSFITTTEVDLFIIDALKNDYYQDMVWLNLHRKEIIDKNNLKFSEGHYHEDIDWTLNYLLNCKKIGYLDEIFYTYRQRENSITNSYKDLELSSDKIYMANQIFNICHNIEDIELRKILRGRATELYFVGAIKGRQKDKLFFKKIDSIKLYPLLCRKQLRRYVLLFNISPNLFFYFYTLKYKIFS